MNTTDKRSVGRPSKGFLESKSGIEGLVMDRNEEETPFLDANIDSVAPSRRSMRDASLRAEELRARMRDSDDGIDFHDDFYIDPRVIPDGWVYNWKRHSTGGMEDEAYAVELRQVGWEAVPAERHPNLVPPNSKGAIIRKGMILMEIPAEIADILRQREFITAREAVEAKERAFKATSVGSFERDHRKTGINKSYGPMAIPTS